MPSNTDFRRRLAEALDLMETGSGGGRKRVEQLFAELRDDRQSAARALEEALPFTCCSSIGLAGSGKSAQVRRALIERLEGVYPGPRWAVSLLGHQDFPTGQPSSW
jgi:hypothetical protein